METPFHRDIVKEICDAAHRHGLKIDLYFSHRTGTTPTSALTPGIHRCGTGGYGAKPDRGEAIPTSADRPRPHGPRKPRA